MLGLNDDSQFLQAGVQTVLDIGCSFGSFGAHLCDTICVAVYEATGSQVQLTLERGLPAMIGNFITRQLPYPALPFEMVHCAQCGIVWDKKGNLDFDLPFKIWVVAKSTNSVCVNGAIHWIDKSEKNIVVFDVGEESFSVVPLSEDCAQEFVDYDDNFPSIVEVGGCVAVFVAKLWEHNKIVLWILKDSQNLVWVKETVTICEIPKSNWR